MSLILDMDLLRMSNSCHICYLVYIRFYLFPKTLMNASLTTEVVATGVRIPWVALDAVVTADTD